MTPAALSVILEAAARSLASALAVWIALRLLRVRNVPAQKTAWSLVLVAALAMPFATRWNWLPAATAIRIPALSWPGASQLHPSPAHFAPAALPAASAKAVNPAVVAPDRFPAPSIAQPGNQNIGFNSGDPANSNLAAPPVDPGPTLAARSAVSAPQSLASASRQWPSRPLALAWLIYLAVAAILLLRLLAGLAAALRIWFSARPVPAVRLADFASGPSVRSSSRVASPVNVASGIVLPADFPAWDAEKLRIVLAHERSHVRQADFYLQFLAGLHAALFWFSPLGWWLKPKLSELAEAIGDCAGLEQAASRASYAELLLEFAARPRLTPRGGIAMARKGNLAPRIEHLLNESFFREAFAAGRRRALLTVLVVPAALFCSTALVRVQAAQATPAPGGMVVPSFPPMNVQIAPISNVQIQPISPMPKLDVQIDQAMRAQQQAIRVQELAIRAKDQAIRRQEQAMRTKEQAMRAQRERTIRAQEQAMRTKEQAMRAQRDRTIRAQEQAMRTKEQAMRAQRDRTIRAQEQTMRAKEEVMRAQIDRAMRAQEQTMRAKEEVMRAQIDRAMRAQEQAMRAQEQAMRAKEQAMRANQDRAIRAQDQALRAQQEHAIRAQH